MALTLFIAFFDDPYWQLHTGTVYFGSSAHFLFWHTMVLSLVLALVLPGLSIGGKRGTTKHYEVLVDTDSTNPKVSPCSKRKSLSQNERTNTLQFKLQSETNEQLPKSKPLKRASNILMMQSPQEKQTLLMPHLSLPVKVINKSNYSLSPICIYVYLWSIQIQTHTHYIYYGTKH